MTLTKVNIEFGQQHPSSNSWIKKLHIQISILCLSVVPGPASQDAVFKLVYASPALQCRLVACQSCLLTSLISATQAE